MEEVKKKYIKSKGRIIENNKYGRSKEEIHKEQRVIGLVEEGLLKEKKETEITIVAAQDQALCTRNMSNVVYGENVQPICRVCAAADETVAHIVSECSKLVQKKYKQGRHDKVAKMLHWKLYENGDLIKQKNGTYTSQKSYRI